MARAGTLPVEDDMPPLADATEWLNSPPMTTEALKGKVVLIDFWTYSCINCLYLRLRLADDPRIYSRQLKK